MQRPPLGAHLMSLAKPAPGMSEIAKGQTEAGLWELGGIWREYGELPTSLLAVDLRQRVRNGR